MKNAWIAVLATGITTGTWAAPAAVDKDPYHLFHPTPPGLMRELSTDRPDKTESPYTVDAGHFQLEMDLVNYSYDEHNVDRRDVTVETLSIAPMNLKLGILNNVDLQWLIEPYVSVRTDDGELRDVDRQSGFGDMVFRSKINIWGNDSGRTALAVMPFVKLPTNQDDIGNNSVEGGIIIPFAVELAAGWSMGLMTEFDYVRDETGGGHHAEFVNSIAVGRDIVGNLGGYVEFFSLVSTESGSDWVGTVDFGFTYLVNANLQLDAGVNIGVTRAADDINPFMGFAWRF